jgi:hypothetical protein
VDFREFPQFPGFGKGFREFLDSLSDSQTEYCWKPGNSKSWLGGGQKSSDSYEIRVQRPRAARATSIRLRTATKTVPKRLKKGQRFNSLVFWWVWWVFWWVSGTFHFLPILGI